MRANNFGLLIIFMFFIISGCKNDAPVDAPVIETKITGKITDSKTGLPIAGVQITTTPTTSSVITGDNGTYTIPNIIPGQVTITARKTGYNDNSSTVSVAEGKTVTADIALTSIGPELEITPTAYNFDIDQNTTIVSIRNKTGIGTVTWNAVTGQTWLSVSPNGGTVTTETDQLTITVNRDAVAFGNYSGVVSVTSDYGNKDINVQMIKSNPNAPQLSVTPIILDFGTNQSSKSIFIKNTGTGSLNWSLTASDPWISASLANGSTASGFTSTVEISVNRNNLSPGSYSGIISVSGGGLTQNVQVKHQILSSMIQAPTLASTGKTTNSINLAWTTVSAANFASFKIFRSTSPGVTESSQQVALINSGSTTTYTDNQLTSGTTYYYRVFVYNTEGLGSGSNEISVITQVPEKNWLLQTQIAGIYEFTHVYANSDNDAFVFGQKASSRGVILHWNGATWTSTEFSNIYSFSGVHFLSASEGYAIGRSYANDSPIILKYDGIQWNVLTIISNIYYFSGSSNDMIYAFASNDIYFVDGSSSKIYHYNGSTVTSVNVGSSSFIGIFAFSTNDIWVYNTAEQFYRWNGIGWGLDSKASALGTKTGEIDKIYALNENFICASGVGFWVFDGLSWSEKKSDQGTSFSNYDYTIFMLNTNLGWIANYMGSIFKYDGTKFTNVPSPTTKGINDIFMLNATSGWAVGNDGIILRYK